MSDAVAVPRETLEQVKAALQSASDFLAWDLKELIGSCAVMIDGEPDLSTIDEDDKPVIDEASERLALVEAALAKIEEVAP